MLIRKFVVAKNEQKALFWAQHDCWYTYNTYEEAEKFVKDNQECPLQIFYTKVEVTASPVTKDSICPPYRYFYIMLINIKGYPEVFVPLICKNCKNCKNSLLHPDTFKWYCCHNTPVTLITEDIDDCPNMVPRLNQFVIAESPHDALQTFITQNPYSTYPYP